MEAQPEASISPAPNGDAVEDLAHDNASPRSSSPSQEGINATTENNSKDNEDQQAQPPPKKIRKKRKPQTEEEKLTKKAKKRKSKDGAADGEGGGRGGKRPRNKSRRGGHNDSLSAAQLAVNEQMRRALEDDKYSALGSIVDTDTDDDEHDFRTSRGGTVRLDRNSIMTAMRKRLRTQRLAGSNVAIVTPTTTSTTNVLEEKEEAAPKKKKVKTVPPNSSRRNKGKIEEAPRTQECKVIDMNDDILGRDEGSIFGQTTGASNATWVECDKCKKWRRLRGVVDEKKLPSKWYCSMNKNDPERARCSAPEEDYETPNTPESAADARTRKHLRVWVRRLESNENYEARMNPTMTRGKKRSAAACSKEPYEWIRCCNPSCGKWRTLLRCMDSKQHVIDRTLNGEWYCVMNTWDEKMASCAAPQENLPVIGCPPWVMQDSKKAND